MDKTIDMARKAGAADIASHGWTSWVGTQSTEFLKRFEALVRADEREACAKRQLVGLTEDEIDEIFNNWPTYNLDHYEFAQVVEAKVFEKNLATAVVIPDVLNPKDENPAFAAGWNDCRAEMLKGRTE
jgi:hypothetical protein